MRGRNHGSLVVLHRTIVFPEAVGIHVLIVVSIWPDGVNDKVNYLSAGLQLVCEGITLNQNKIGSAQV